MSHKVAQAQLGVVYDEPDLLVQGDFSFASSGAADDEVGEFSPYIDNGFLHVRWTARWLPRLGTELFAQVQFNEFQKLTYRLLGGAGVRVPLMLGSTFEAFAGTAYMLEYEELDIDPGDAHPAETVYHRWSSYLTMRLNVKKYLRVLSTTYVQPRFDALSDLRVLQEVVLEVDVVKHISLLVVVSVHYDGDAPDEVESTDIIFAPKLRLTL